MSSSDLPIYEYKWSLLTLNNETIAFLYPDVHVLEDRCRLTNLIEHASKPSVSLDQSVNVST